MFTSHMMYDHEKNRTMTHVVTKGDLIKKFKSLHATYYVIRGAMISTVPDLLSETFIKQTSESEDYVWKERYNSYASDRVNIRTITVEVPIFDKWFEVGLDRPLIPEHRYEFEEYFGFGGHCDKYSENRIVFRFMQDKNSSYGSIESILLPEGSNEDDPFDFTYAENAFRLLVFGGYVKYWAAVSEFETWFIDVAGMKEIVQTKNGMASYIFENMRPKNN